MHEIHFSSLDLNLLRVFQALLEDRSVTRAGRRLGLSQSAVSHALNRLRHILGDELFTRGPGGMRPTPRAQEIAPRLNEGLRQLQLALAPTRFDPAQTTRCFNIAVSAYGAAVLMPSVIAAMRAAAPMVEIRLQRLSRALGEELLTGRVDLAVGGFGRSTPDYERETLFAETMAWAVRADHPVAQSGALTLEALAAIDHVVVATGEEEDTIDGRIDESGLERRVIWDDRGAIDEVMARAGIRRRVAVTVHDVHGALAIVSRGDMAALAPRRLLTTFAGQYGLKRMESPYSASPTQMEALWRRENGDAPPMVWLRSLLRQAASQL